MNDDFDFYDWLFFSDRNRIIWIASSSFSLGLFASMSAFTHQVILPPLMILFLIGIILLVIGYKRARPIIETITVETEKVIEREKRVFVRPDSGCGVIYIMRRSDGVLKFGKAHRLQERLRQHQKDYQADFHVISSWVVPDVDGFETIALSLTKNYQHKEGQRRELRQMSESELNKFVLDFTNKVYQGWVQ